MELYYAIMNILDYIALNELSKDKKENLYKSLDHLLSLLDGDTISDISSANDCGICNTWEEIVEKLRELFEEGERI